MREILVYDDYKLHKLGPADKKEYEEVTTEKATRIDVSDVAKRKGRLIPFGKTEQSNDKLIYVCVGTESGTYHFTYNSINYQFTMPTIQSGDILIFNKSNTELSLNANTIVTETGTAGIELNFSSTPNDILPQIIVNVGERRQLFNKNDFVSTKLYIANNQNIFGLASNLYGIIMNVEKFQYLTISKISSSRFGIAASNVYPENGSEGILLKPVQSDDTEATVDVTDYKYLVINYYSATADTITEQDILDSIQIEEGIIKTPYKAFRHRIDLIINFCNDNIFDEDTVEFVDGLLDDNGQPTTGSSHYTANYYRVKPNTTYKILGETTTTVSSKRIYFYDKHKKWISRSNMMGFNNVEFTTPANCYYVRLQVTQSINLKNNVMLCEYDNVAYVKHKQQVIVFPLYQKLMQGDYLADDGIHHVSKQDFVNLNYVTYSQTTGLKVGVMNSSYKKQQINTRALCDRASLGRSKAGDFYVNKTNFAFLGTANDTLETLKERFDGSIIEYELDAEEIETYTEEQQIAYNKLKKLLLYKGATHIWTEVDGLEPDLQLTYKRIKLNETLQVNNIQPVNLEMNNLETPEQIDLIETPAELTIEETSPEENEVI